MAKLRFRAVVETAGPADAWCFVRLPAKVTAALGVRGRVSVDLTAGRTVFPTSAFPDGKGGHHLMFNKAMQAASGAGPKDSVELALEVAAGPRKVALPADLKRALAAHPGAKAFFDGLSPSCRREYAGFVDEAKRPETRARRIAQTLAMLKEGKRRVKS